MVAARLFMGRMLALLRNSHGKKIILLDKDFFLDLNWFCVFLCQFNGKVLLPSPKREKQVYVDACLVGIGAKFDNQVYAAKLPFIGHGLSIVHYEMINIVVAFNLWGREWSNCNVKVYCDNEAVVTCISSHKIKDAYLMTCVRNLWLMAARYN